MATSLAPRKCAAPTTKEVEEEKLTPKNSHELFSTLPRKNGWITEYEYQYQGFWYADYMLEGLLSLQKNFEARSTNEVLVASFPKSGTTWLMALLFAITNRTLYDYPTHPLLTAHPHECVPMLEFYALKHSENPNPEVPVLATHISYTSLPESLLHSSCRIIYVLREPKDVFISFWHFATKLRKKELPALSLEEAFDQFCNGVSVYGPYWDHLSGYSNASMQSPEKVLVLEYEDMKRKPLDKVKELADFIGHPFSLEEETQGVIEKIMALCSFENLSSLEVNKIGTHNPGTPFVVHNNTFFRQGKTGNAKNYLTKEMAERLDHIIAQKFKESGLMLHVASK